MPTFNKLNTSDYVEGPRPESPVRRWFWRLVFICALLFVLVPLCEYGLRAFLETSAPGFFTEGTVNGVPSVVPNEDAARQFFLDPTIKPRDFTIPIAKRENTVRIFIIGGSAAYGFPDPAFAFDRSLELKLQHRFPGSFIELFNLSLPGLTSYGMLKIAQQSVDYDPDLVIIQPGLHEVDGPFGPGCEPHRYTAFESVIRVKYAIQASTFSRSIPSDQDALASQDPALASSFRSSGKPVAASARSMKKMHTRYRKNVQKIAVLFQSAGAQVIIVHPATRIWETPPFQSVHSPKMSPILEQDWLRPFHEGIRAGRGNNYESSLTYFEQALQIDEEHAELLFHIANSYVGLRQSEEASTFYHDACERDALHRRPDQPLERILKSISEKLSCPLLQPGTLIQQKVIAGDNYSTWLFDERHLTPAGSLLLSDILLNQIESIPSLFTQASPRPSQMPAPTNLTQWTSRLCYTDFHQAKIALAFAEVLSSAPYTGSPLQRSYWDEEIRALKKRGASWRSEQFDTIKSQFSYRLFREPKDLVNHLLFVEFLISTEAYGKARARLDIAEQFVIGRNQRHEALGTLLSQRTHKLNETVATYLTTTNTPFTKRKNAEAFQLAGKCKRADEPEAAMRIYTKLLSHPSSTATAHYFIGELLKKQGRHNEAWTHYQQALESHSTFEDALHAATTMMIEAGQRTKAASFIRKTLKKNPRSRVGRRHLAKALTLKRKHEMAEHVYKTLLKEDEEDPETQHALAELYLIMKEYRLAENLLATILETNPFDSVALNAIGKSQIARGQLREGLQNLVVAVQYDPENPAILNDLAWKRATHSVKEMRNAEESIWAAETANSLSNHANPIYLDTLAAAYAEAGNFEAAEKFIKQALAATPAKGYSKLKTLLVEHQFSIQQHQPIREP